MIKEIITNEEDLRKRSKEVDIKKDKITRVIKDLKDTLDNSDRLFLTANQIGHDYRIGAMKFADTIKIMINPAFKRKDKMILFREKDYLTNNEYIIPRFSDVDCVYQEKDNDKLDFGEIKSYKLSEGAAITFCRMIDALNGLLDQDYGLIILPEFDQASEEEKSELLEEYVKQFKTSFDEIDKDLSSDESEDVKKAWRDAKFIKAVDEGKIEVQQPEMSNKKKRKLIRWLKSMGVKRKDMKI